MAQEIVGFKIEINGQEKVVKSLGEMKQLIKEANFELLAAQQNFGEYSKEALDAAKKVATLKDAVQEAGETAQLFDPGKKFQVFAGALNAAAGGIAAFQGALGLVGVESENVQKSLLKVQSALALSQGLSTIADSAKDFQRLASVISNLSIVQKAYNFVMYGTATATRAADAATKATAVSMRVLRGVMASLGIGALVIGVGLLVEKIIAWTNRTSEAEKQQNKLNEAVKKQNAEIDNQIRVLEALGGQEDKIALKRKQQIDNELNNLRGKLKTQGKLTEEELAQFRKLKTDKEVLDIQEANRIKKSQEKTKESNKETNKVVVDDSKRALQELEDARIENIENEYLRNEAKINIDFERRKADIEDLKVNEQTKTALIIEEEKKRDKALEENRKLIQAKEEEANLTANVRNVNQKAIGLSLEKSYQNNLNQIQKAGADTQALIDEQVVKLKKDRANEIATTLQNLTNVVGKDTLAGKALGIATALINTYQGASEAIKQKSTLPSPFDVITKVANVGAIIATGLKTVKAITAVQVPGVGGGATPSTPSVSATAPITPSAPLVNTRTQLDSITIQQLGSATNRSYVLESDVTNSQERIRRINRAARLA